MILTAAGESRINGYLFVLKRSLSAGLPREVARDAVREIESHLRERIAAVESGDERVALERILAEARANAAEMMVAIFVMMIVGIVLAFFVQLVQSYLLRWQPRFEQQA